MKRNNWSRRVASAVLFGLFAIPGSVFAQEAETPSEAETANPDAVVEADEGASENVDEFASTEPHASDDGLPEDDASVGEQDAAFDDAFDMGDLESLLGESVVTTASRSAERASTAPSTVFTITADEMRRFGIRSVDEALDYLGLGVYTASARDYTSGIDVGAQGVLIRDRGRHILALLDGHILNSQGTGGVSINEAFGVPLELISHVEVMLGAGSVMYGSNAMLAVINVVTRKARDLPTSRFVAEVGTSLPGDNGRLRGPGDGNSMGLRYRVGASGAVSFSDTAEVTVAAEWLAGKSASYGVGPITSGEGSASWRPGETEWGGNATHDLRAPSGVVNVRLGDFHLMFAGNYYERGMPLVGTFMESRSKETQTGLRGEVRHSLDIDERIVLGSRLYLDYHAFRETSSYGEDFWCLQGQVNGCDFSLGGDAQWIGLEEQAVADWYLDGSLTSTLGIDVRGRQSYSASADFRDPDTGDLSTVVPRPTNKRSGLLVAVFAQQVWRPYDWVTFNLGGRLDTDTSFPARVSPRAAVTFTPSDTASVRASYSEAFRGPTPYEFDEFDPTYRLAPDDLKPEIVRAAELEWQQRLNKSMFSLRGFASFYSNFIDSREATQEEFDAAQGRLSSTAELEYVIINDNLSTISSYGGSASASTQIIDGVTLAGNFNYAYTRRDGEALGVIPSWFGNLRASYQPSPDGTAVSLATRFGGSRRVVADLWATEERVGKHLDLRLAVAGPLWDAISYRAAVGYSFNENLPYAIATPEEGVPGGKVQLIPVAPRLFAFVGLQYEYDRE